MKKLYKTAAFSDIHFGRKSNSETHNRDCINFIEWFCDNVTSDKNIDHISFLGDWNENRSSLNISTLNFSYKAAKMLDSLGLPVFFIIGNHDLYYRTSREIHSVIHHNEFENFIIIEEPTLFENIGEGALYSPYLFHEEYPSLTKYRNVKTWWGHFEFKGFIVTGYNITMPTGAEAQTFSGPKYIFSGHFHKRQYGHNVIYIGNTFPMDFGDAGDFERGMMTYDHRTDDVIFKNWEECPKYIKTNITDVSESKTKRDKILLPKSYVNCAADIQIDFDESNFLRQKFIKDYELRDFNFEEIPTFQSTIQGDGIEIDFENQELESVNDLVLVMLNNIEDEEVDKELLINIYKNLNINQE